MIHNAWRYHVTNKMELVILNGDIDPEVGEFYPYAGPTQVLRVNPNEGDFTNESVYNHHRTFNKGSVWFKERNDELAKEMLIKYLKTRIEEYEKLIANINLKIDCIENNKNIILRIRE